MESEKGKITVIKNYFDKEIYSPETSQIKHHNNRKKCGVKIKGYGKCEKFLKWIEEMVLVKKYSIDAAVGYAKKHNLFLLKKWFVQRRSIIMWRKGK